MNRAFWERKSILSLAAAVCVIALLSGCTHTKSAPVTDEGSKAGAVSDFRPQTKPVIRVGCFRGEDYYYWNDELKTMASILKDDEIIGKYDDEDYGTMEETWEALCASEGLTPAGCLEFVDGYLFTYDQMSDEELEAMLDIDDIDLMLTFGTASGRFLTENADRFDYDYMVFGATNTVASGIVKSETERNNDHSFALTDVNESRRQLEAAYDLFRFRDIGVVYENNADAYVYSGIDILEELSDKYGFTIHTEYVDESSGGDDDERFLTELKAAYDRLQPDIDAMFITTSTLMPEDLEYLISDMTDAGVITIAQESEEFCQNGAMMHLLVACAQEDGQFMAKTITDYCAGVPITQLDMVYVGEPRLYLNAETVKRAGIKIPLSAYLIADTIYTKEDAE